MTLQTLLWKLGTSIVVPGLLYMWHNLVEKSPEWINWLPMSWHGLNLQVIAQTALLGISWLIAHQMPSPFQKGSLLGPK